MYIFKDITEENGGRVFAARGEFIFTAELHKWYWDGPSLQGADSPSQTSENALDARTLEYPARRGRGCVTKPEPCSEFTGEHVNLPTDKEISECCPSHADKETRCGSCLGHWWWTNWCTHGVIWCPHLHLMLPMLSRDFRGRFCPRGFEGDKLCLLSESQEHYLNSCRLQNGWCQTKCTGWSTSFRGNKHMYTHRRVRTHTLLKWLSCNAAEAHSLSPATLTWDAMDLSPAPAWSHACLPIEKRTCPDAVLVSRKSSAAAGNGRACEPMSHSLGSTGSCLWIRKNPFFPRRRGCMVCSKEEEAG